jgi:rod shape-determining protein MreC
MDKIFKTFFIFREYITVLIAIILSSFLLVSNENRQVEKLQEMAIDFTGKIKQNFVWVSVVMKAVEENGELKEKVLNLTLENTYLKNAEVENQKLKRMLDFESNEKLKYLPAMVISKGFHQIVNSIQIDVGENDSVKKNMPVITEDGLVGKVYLVGKENSLVQMMTDINFRVSVRILRTRAVGIVYWKSEDLFEINNVPKSFDVAVGDTVITSGYSQIYPPELPVGVISEISDNVPGMFKKIVLKTFVNFNSIEKVFIIFPGIKQEFVLE